MLIDREGNLIKLAGRPNSHILILGGSGCGKSFAGCRFMEENGKIIVIDYSGSYSKEELKKNGLSNRSGAKIFNPKKSKFYFIVKEDDDKKFQKNMVDTLVKVLNIQGYTQEEILQEGVSRHMENHKTMNFSEFFETLKELLLEKKALQETDNIKNLSKLMQRLRGYSDIEGLHIVRCGTAVKRGREKVTIVQLSDYSASQRSFLTDFLITMLWKEIVSNNGCEYDSILLDEFQYLMKQNCETLYDMLREGRKRGISLILCTQFIDGYDGEQRDALMQCGNILFFRPTAKDVSMCAKLIDEEESGVWRKLLKNLNIGEAVLLGHYCVNERRRIYKRPIVCKIQRKEKG